MSSSKYYTFSEITECPRCKGTELFLRSEKPATWRSLDGVITSIVKVLVCLNCGQAISLTIPKGEVVSNEPNLTSPSRFNT